ncbi:MAG: GGDEF domain-containing phosphodiesterase, partial [Lachnospiraceae bacterium]|nr:GGDEF domain-containing phosphodiesterase [Lachnospiraceae bacterium]
MAKARDINIKKIKKTNFLGILLAFVLLSVIQIGFVILFIRVFVDYVVNFKLEDRYNTIQYMADLYDANPDDETIYATLDTSGIDYLITDEDGNIVHQTGENTCNLDHTETAYLHLREKIRTYKDSEDDLYILDDHQISVHYTELYRRMIEYSVSSDGFSANTAFEDEDLSPEEAAEQFENLLSSAVHLPLWLSVDINNGSGQLIGKAIVSMDSQDLFMIAGYILIVVTFSITVFIMLMIAVISNVNNSRRALRIFFTDAVTRGHNWLWYTYRGEQILRSPFHAKNNYAIVNLVFLKYRNYCMCHSIPEGEKLLKQVYERILSNITRKEMLAHVSSSNFALLLRYGSEDELRKRLNNLIADISNVDDGHDHIFNFQAGVDLLPARTDEKGRIVRRRGVDIEVEYNNACAARNAVSEREDSCVSFFDDALIEEQKWLDAVFEEQKSALNNEEFLVYYQPKYDPNTNELRGAEALIRWQSPRLGFVSPGKFIPIFEKNGFITEIDHYMLRHVARDQKKWLDMGLSCVPVSVNVSRAHFVEEDLAEQIRDIVDGEGAPRNLVEIELTESAFFDDKNALLTTVTRLQEYGFAVSMDDFGSGYSSLNSLKDMPLDVLKIDAEFFRGDNAKDRGKVVVSETIKLAKSLDMRIVAEGVETKD